MSFTSNHIHLIVYEKDSRETIPKSIQLLAGRTVQMGSFGVGCHIRKNGENFELREPQSPIMLFLMLKRAILKLKTYGFGTHKA
jgi:uncharacterized protein (UPF0128 family)